MNLQQVLSKYEQLRIEGSHESASHVLFDAWHSGLQNSEVLYKLAESFYLRKNFEQAEKFVSHALKYQPENPKYNYLAGMNALALNEIEIAIQRFGTVPQASRLFYADIELAKLHKKDADANYGCDFFAIAYQKNSDVKILADYLQHRIEVLRYRAEISREEILAINSLLERYEVEQPNSSKFMRFKAQFLYYLGELQDSSVYYQRYLSLHPDSQVAQYNLSQVLLGLGQYLEGFALMRNRQQVHIETGGNKAFAESIGLSELAANHIDYVKGKCLVVIPEQGLGDQIWSMSFLQTFADHFECSLEVWVVPKLFEVAQSLELASVVVKNLLEVSEHYLKQDSDHPAKFFISCIDLFFLLKMADVPLSSAQSFMSSDEHLTAELRDKYKNDQSNAMVGLSWKSFDSGLGNRKNLPLSLIGSLSSQETIRFISCQYGEVAKDISQLRLLGLDIIDDEDIDNYSSLVDAFSQIDACDKVITCSNVVAHIAGALGKTTLLICSSPSIWYWNQEGTSCWYESVEVVKKTLSDPWSDVYSRLQKFLS